MEPTTLVAPLRPQSHQVQREQAHQRGHPAARTSGDSEARCNPSAQRTAQSREAQERGQHDGERIDGVAEEEDEALHQPEFHQDVAQPQAQEVAEGAQPGRAVLAQGLAAEEGKGEHHQHQCEREGDEEQDLQDGQAQVVAHHLPQVGEQSGELRGAQGEEEEGAVIRGGADVE